MSLRDQWLPRTSGSASDQSVPAELAQFVCVHGAVIQVPGAAPPVASPSEIELGGDDVVVEPTTDIEGDAVRRKPVRASASLRGHRANPACGDSCVEAITQRACPGGAVRTLAIYPSKMRGRSPKFAWSDREFSHRGCGLVSRPHRPPFMRHPPTKTAEGQPDERTTRYAFRTGARGASPCRAQTSRRP